MSVRTGPFKIIYAATTIPGTAAVAMTAVQCLGNSVRLQLTTTTGGSGTITITAEESTDNVTYYDVIDTNSVWSHAVTTTDTAGAYVTDLEGLACIPGMWYRLSYTAATAAGKIAVGILNWENPNGGGMTVSVPDVVVAELAIAVDMAAVEALLTTIAGDTTSLDDKQPALGTAVMAAASPVTIATDDTVATDLTAIKTAVEIMDDWDETDRAAVNTIAGQVGVAGGAGAVSALTQRVIVATDQTALPVTESNPTTDHHAEATVADVTDGTDDTYPYFLDMDGFRREGLQLVLDGGSGTVTVTIWGSIQDDGTAQASVAYENVSTLFGKASWTASDIILDDTGATGLFKYLKAQVIASTGAADDADWAIYGKRAN